MTNYGNAWNSNVPAKESKGGTGNASYTMGDTLYASGATTLSKRAVGAAGKVYTVVGGVPDWATAATPGSLVFLTSQTASNSSSLGFTSQISATYNTYFFVGTQLVPASNANTLVAEYSQDNGATYENTDYVFYTETFRFTNGVQNTSNGITQLYIRMMPPGTVSNTAGAGVNFEGWLFGPLLPSYHRITYEGNYRDSASGSDLHLDGSGSWANTNTINAIRWRFTSGNITSGKISLYGLANS